MTAWTIADCPDQTGRTFVVTGANSGLGLETTKALTGRGAKVVMACRDMARAEAARRQVPGDAEVRTLDLADLASVRAFAEDLPEQRVDVLINNAGLMNIPYARTAQGYEMQFGVNVVGHFLLTQLLVPRLTDRVVWLGSLMHRFGRIDLDDLTWQRRRYNTVQAYSQSKLACVMLAYEQQRRFIRDGAQLRAMAAHPGYSATNLQTRSRTPLDRVMGALNAVSWVAQPAAMGALPQLYAATVPDLPGGTYVGPGGLGETRGNPRPVSSNAASHDRAVAAALWDSCEELAAAV